MNVGTKERLKHYVNVLEKRFTIDQLKQQIMRFRNHEFIMEVPFGGEVNGK